MSHDLIVIGAGPAGVNAALAASRHGLAVVLIDEAEQAGGQVYRAPYATGEQHNDPDTAAGSALRRALVQSNVDWRPGRRVWSVAKGFRIDTTGADGPEVFTASRLVAATGAHERVVPFPGWTLPGVIGLAAATILIKSQTMLPGGRVIVAGCGPLLAAVAAKVAAGGGNVVTVVDLAGPLDWIAAVPRLLRRPRLLARGLGWALDLGRNRVPVHFRHTVVAAEGHGQVAHVRIAPVDREGRTSDHAMKSFDVETLVVGHGLVPGAEIPRLLRATMQFDRRRGGWIPVTDPHGRTSIEGLFAIGDGAGIRGAESASLAGEIAGAAAAFDAGKLGRSTHAEAVAPLVRQLASYAPFADASADFMALRPAHVASIGGDTIVCRCEDLTRSDIEAAARDGAYEVNQLKQFTRCGMGPCQGRMCGDVAGEILAQSRGVPREAVGFWTARPPLRPVPVDEIIGDFDYSDIPIPKPAPL